MGSGVTSDGGAVFIKEDILVAVQVIFNAPMGPVESQDVWGCFIKACDKIGGFHRCFAGFVLLSGAGDGAHGLKTRPCFFEGLRGRDQGDVSCFAAAVAAVFGGVVLSAGGARQQRKTAVNVPPQFSLVIFDGEQVITSLVGDDTA